MNPMRNSPALLQRPALRQATLACLFLSFVGGSRLLAQAAPAVTATDNEVIELSPFVVTSDNDQGYRAASTLAGTRLRTDLKDVAASVSVITKDFMTDINATNYEALLNYTLGSEVTGMGGNFFGGVAGGAGDLDNGTGLREPQQRARIRGLDDADQTRDYFLTTISTDSYNTDRVDISRGANAILFGLGSPAGIVNAGLIKASTTRAKTTYELQLDNYGTIRHTLDTNQVLIKDKLALRVAGLLSNREFKQEPAYVQDKRVTATVTYRPWEGGTLRVTGESARQKSNRPQNRPPFDFISQWWQVGKPVFSMTGGFGSVALTGAPVNAFITADNVTDRFGYGTGINVILANPASPTIGQSVLVTGTPNTANAQGYFTSPAFNWDNTLRRLGGGYPNYNKTLNARIHQSNANTSLDPNFNFWRHPMLTDPSIFNFYSNLLEGPNKREWAFWDTINATFEQRLGKNAGIEVAYDRQTFENGYINPFNFTDGYAIFLDINRNLADGSLNPNFGRPYINNNSWQGSYHDDRDTFRLQGYYDLDLKNVVHGWLGRLLGRHTFTGNYTDYTRKESSYGGRPYVLGLDYVAATQAQGRLPGWQTPSLSGGADFRMVSRTAYLGPSIVGAASAAGANARPITAAFNLDGLANVSTQWYDSGTASYSVRSFSLIQSDRYDVSRTTAFGVHTLTKSQIKSTSFVMNGRWWDDTLISNLGWREDKFRFYGDNGLNYDATTGLALVGSQYQMINPAPSLADKETTFSYGLVAHLPPQFARHLPLHSTFSVFYNSADNFRPTAQEYNIYNQPVSAPTGKTKDYGILIQMLDGKVDLRITHYRSSIIASRNLKDPLRESINDLIRFPSQLLGAIAGQPYQNLITATPSLQTGVTAFDTWLAGPVGSVLANTFKYNYGSAANGRRIITSFDNRINQVTGTTDSVSTGMEYELSYNPTRNWRITANASEQKVTLSNIDPALRTFVTDFSSTLKSNSALAGLPTGADAAALTVAQRADQISSNLNRTLLKEGQTNPEVRQWRFNLINNYSWSEGMLKGWFVGGAVRWQDKAAIGYAIKTVTDALGTSYFEDITRPYYGPAETNYDVWVGDTRKLKLGSKSVNWKVQLNVRNLGVGNKLIPVAANPDGSYGTYRIAEPQTITLTNTFEF